MQINNGQTIEASKEFSVPAEKVYEAWNNANQLKQWWKPLGNELKEVENHLKEGGTVKYIFTDNTLVISGAYEEVKQNEKLVYSWNWEFPDNAIKNASYKLTIEFSAKDNGSMIKVRQDTVQSAETVHPNEEGWDKGLTDLQNFLSGNDKEENASNQATANTSQEASGYRESPEQQKVGGG